MMRFLLQIPLFLLSLCKVSGQEQPYMVSFIHPDVDLRTTCTAEFYNVRDYIYRNYVIDMISNTTLQSTTALQIDPTWPTTTFDFSNYTRSGRRELKHSRCKGYCNRAVSVVISKSCCNACSGCRRRLDDDAPRRPMKKIRKRPLFPPTKRPVSSPKTKRPSSPPQTDSPTSLPTTQLPTPTPFTDSPSFPPQTDSPTLTPATQLPSTSPVTDSPSFSAQTNYPTPLLTTTVKESPKSMPQREFPTSNTQISPTQMPITNIPSIQFPLLMPVTDTPTFSPQQSDSSNTMSPTLLPTSAEPTLTPVTGSPSTLQQTQAQSAMTPVTEVPTDSPTSAPQTVSPTSAPQTISPTSSPETNAPTTAPSIRIPTRQPTTKNTFAPSTPKRALAIAARSPTGEIIVTGSGNSDTFIGTSSVIGRNIVAAFYETVSTKFPEDHPCKPILLETQFEVQRVQVVYY